MKTGRRMALAALTVGLTTVLAIACAQEVTSPGVASFRPQDRPVVRTDTFSATLVAAPVVAQCSGYNIATGQCETAPPFSLTPTVVSKIFAKIPACPGAGFITVDGVDFRIAGVDGLGSNSPSSGLLAGATYWLDNGTTDGHGNGVFYRSWVLTDDQRADEKVWINTWRPLDSQKNCP